jgi:hypothetical protein
MPRFRGRLRRPAARDDAKRCRLPPRTGEVFAMTHVGLVNSASPRRSRGYATCHSCSICGHTMRRGMRRCDAGSVAASCDNIAAQQDSEDRTTKPLPPLAFRHIRKFRRTSSVSCRMPRNLLGAKGTLARPPRVRSAIFGACVVVCQCGWLAVHRPLDRPGAYHMRSPDFGARCVAKHVRSGRLTGTGIEKILHQSQTAWRWPTSVPRGRQPYRRRIAV